VIVVRSKAFASVKTTLEIELPTMDMASEQPMSTACHDWPSVP
jgi:hypothetical protein